jgi:hypothetical protein
MSEMTLPTYESITYWQQSDFLNHMPELQKAVSS